jgi:hypothetical protein
MALPLLKWHGRALLGRQRITISVLQELDLYLDGVSSAKAKSGADFLGRPLFGLMQSFQ